MQQKLLSILELADSPQPVALTRLSFKAFVDFVRSRVHSETGFRKETYHRVLDCFSKHPELEAEVAVADLHKYTEQLEMIFAVLNSSLQEEKNLVWALSIPLNPVIFYGTDPFYQLMLDRQTPASICSFSDAPAFLKKIKEHFYSFVLERFYGIKFSKYGSIIRTVTNVDTQLSRHFKLSLDTRFVEAEIVGQLPELDEVLIRLEVFTDNVMQMLEEKLPPSLFSFSGFTVMNITEVTIDFALEEIKNNIVSGLHEGGRTTFPAVIKSLKEMAGTADIEFNILPFYRVNGRLVDDMDAYCQSIIFSCGNMQGLQREMCMSLIESFTNGPKLVFFADLDEEGPSQRDISKLFYKYGIKSYALMPVYYNNRLVGALELYSSQKSTLTDESFNLLQPASQLLGQLVMNSITAFNDELESVIKDKFTSLQPSVQWKFNEVAWHYLQSRDSKSKNREPDEIEFQNVFPLYGAVDIRNSTVERNSALVEDLKVQLNTLVKTLHHLRELSGFGLLDEKIFQTRQWLGKVTASGGFEQELILNDFLQHEITPFLSELTASNPEFKHVAQDYFDTIDEATGLAFENRRQLEQSMSTLIAAVNNYFDLLKNEIQHSYPCYFEKFRTDGVEYDIYIGQSITPGKPYSNIYLQNLRLMQLRSMAAIASFSRSLQAQLSWPVATTQLIFIHSHPIDIKFRRDEKRFDVEGAYNIRYHIIKKRIDKVRLKNSRERLTQPDKIALVYFSQNEADEYISYIKYLQQDKILRNDLEYLELEELQGVAGLKALRVGVNLDSDAAATNPESISILQNI